ncbi:MAG TPA: heavy metal translocating P-type ATPase [Gemmatimonadales bacterium]|nr:heavy metal translocating P-type ATPase [Gemmatimonadales bacterium]
MSPRARALLLPSATLAALLAGWLLPHLASAPTRQEFWMVALAIVGLPTVVGTGRMVLRGRLNADLVAALAIITALLLAQPFPGLIVVLMQTGGEALERYAARRARAAVSELEAALPRLAHRIAGAGFEDIPVEQISIGDRLQVRPGELVPCDGRVVDGRSHVDVSRLTGEPAPVTAQAGVRLMSGSINGESPLVLEATAVAAESQYARIVGLVREAQDSKAPLQRLADRAAVWFTPLTLAACVAAWAATGDPGRILAVLVVATPCPLILATPVAIIGGISRAAGRRIVFRHGGAIEQLGQVEVAVFDKTGTLTIGRPAVAGVTALAPYPKGEVLRLAAAVEQGSGHLLARSVVEAGQRAEGTLPAATHVVEAAGRGVSGRVEGRAVAVGSIGWIEEETRGAAEALKGLEGTAGELRAAVSIDGRPAGLIAFADQVRPDLAPFFAQLRALGISRSLLLTGDRAAAAEHVAATAGIREVHADLLPEDKTRIVAELSEAGQRVMMVGDGTNDAPALARATVGIALAAHGGGISAEAADVVILADDLSRVAEAIRISRRTLRIARQSIRVGLGLSISAMVAAAAGYIAAPEGALLQEAIDVAVILNALRTSFAGET